MTNEPSMTPGLRLVKALLQFQFPVIVGGEERMQATPPFYLDAADWPMWTEARFPAGVIAVAQFTFVLDDGLTLKEQVSQPVSVEAQDWSSFTAEQFPGLVRELKSSVTQH